MSVMLTACRNNKKRNENIKKKTKQKKRESSSSSEDERTSDEGSGYVNPCNVKMWSWLLDNKETTVIFRRDTLDVWVGDDKVETMCNFTDNGSDIDFCYEGHKARITNKQGQDRRDGIVQTLTIDGYVIPALT